MTSLVSALRLVLAEDAAIARREFAALDTLTNIIGRLDDMSKQMDDLVLQVAANAKAESDAATLIQSIHDKLVDAGTDQTKLAALQAELASSAGSLTAVVAADTDAAPATSTTSTTTSLPADGTPPVSSTTSTTTTDPTPPSPTPTDTDTGTAASPTPSLSSFTPSAGS